MGREIWDVALFVDIRPGVADWQRAAGAAISNWALIRKDSVFEGTAGQPPIADVMLLPGTKAKPKAYFRLRYEESSRNSPALVITIYFQDRMPRTTMNTVINDPPGKPKGIWDSHDIDDFSATFDPSRRAECPREHSPGLRGPGIPEFSKCGLKGHENVRVARFSRHMIHALHGSAVWLRFVRALRTRAVRALILLLNPLHPRLRPPPDFKAPTNPINC